jgi:hypothetical protein
MINLEKLKLYLSILRFNSTYVDGIQLYDEIIIYMSRLKKLYFSIDTCVMNNNIKIDLSSNKDIQHSFIGRRYGQVGSDVYSIAIEKGISRCHIYSLPYQFQQFYYLNNSFKGGIFNKVRFLLMVDSRPFEHNFFKVISQDFPFLKRLCILNYKPQQNKQQSSTIIFPHLILLDLATSDVDYAEQFLFDKNTHLPRLLNLSIGYELLAMVTNNFTNDAARLNCAKLTNLEIKEPFVRPKNFHQYFPLL